MSAVTATEEEQLGHQYLLLKFSSSLDTASLEQLWACYTLSTQSPTAKNKGSLEVLLPKPLVTT